MEKIYYKIIKKINKENKKNNYTLIVSILPIFDEIGYSIIDNSIIDMGNFGKRYKKSIQI